MHNETFDKEQDTTVTRLTNEENALPTNHRSNYLLAFIPFVVLFLLHILSSGSIPPILTTLYALFFAWLGRKRRSDLLSVYWLAGALGSVFVILNLFFKELRLLYSGNISLFFGDMPLFVGILFGSVFIICVLTTIWFGRLIGKNQHDKLFIAFATLPLVFQGVLVFASDQFYPVYLMKTIFSFQPILSILLRGLALGLFFIGSQRRTKWVGVFILVLVSQGINTFSIYLPFSLLFYIIATVLLTVAVSALFFWWDSRSR